MTNRGVLYLMISCQISGTITGLVLSNNPLVGVFIFLVIIGSYILTYFLNEQENNDQIPF